MIENDTKFEILYEKSKEIEKTRQRMFLIVILSPLFYLLLKNSIIDEVDLSLFSIKKISVVLLFFPTLYTSLLFYISILTNHNSKLIDELNLIASDATEATGQYKKERWLIFLGPMNVLGNILGSIRAGGILGCLGGVIVFIPVVLVVILYPLVACIYFICFNFQQLGTDLHYMALYNALMSIWILVASSIYSLSAK